MAKESKELKVKRVKPLKGLGKKAQYKLQPFRTEDNKRKKILKQIKKQPNDLQAKFIARKLGFIK